VSSFSQVGIMKILIIERRDTPPFPYMFTRTWQGMFLAAQKDLSSPKSLAVRADNLTSKVGRLNFVFLSVSWQNRHETLWQG
jgi:hypothetical protein